MTAIGTKPADTPQTPAAVETVKASTVVLAGDHNEPVAADSGKTSTPLPPAVSVKQTRNTGTLDAQIQATKRDYEFTARLKAIRAARDDKYMSSYDRGELIEQCLTLAKEAAVKAPFTVSAAYAEAAALVEPVITRTLERLQEANARYTTPVDAASLSRATTVANVLARGGGKAEYDSVAKAMQQIAKAGDATGQAMCNSIAELRRQAVTTEERAWTLAGLAHGLSTEDRVAARLAADVTTPDNVHTSIDIAKQAMEDGDYRFACSLLAGVVRGVPSTLTAELHVIMKNAQSNAEAFSQEYPDAAFTYDEVKSLSELCLTLQAMARPKAGAQELALVELAAHSSIDDADYELRQLGYQVESAKKADPVDQARLADITAAYERIAAIVDGEAEEQIAKAIDAFKTVPTLLDAPSDVFRTAFERWQKLQERNVASADAFKSVCAKGIGAAMKSWDARLATLKAGPAAAANEAKNGALYSAKTRLETMLSVVQVGASEQTIKQTRGQVVKLSLDFIELSADIVAQMPELDARNELRGDLSDAKHYIESATDPQDVERATKLVQRLKQLINR